MRKAANIIAILLLAMASSPASAALPPFKFLRILGMADAPEPHPEVEARYTPAFKACLANPDLSNLDQQQCDQQEMVRQDGRLNDTWRTTFARMAPAARAELRTSQRLWIKQREAHCRLAAKEAEGSLSAVLYGQCVIDESIRRTTWLEQLR